MNLNTASLAHTILFSHRSLRLIAFFALPVLLNRFTARKVVHLVVNSHLRSKAPSNAHASVLIEFTPHWITHAVASLASISKTLTM
jgi:hypothetical protein